MTSCSFIYHFDTGEVSEIAKGTIDAGGYITIEKIQTGQEDRVQSILDEYNTADHVFLKGARSMEGEAHSRLTKTQVHRYSDGFLDALQQSMMRFYRVELRVEGE